MPSEPRLLRSPCTIAPTGVRVALRVQPGASRSTVDGLQVMDDGGVVLALRVAAAARDGAANAAAIELLAKTWRLPKTAMRIIAGQRQRRKSVLIAGDSAALKTRLETWIAGRPLARDRVARHQEA